MINKKEIIEKDGIKYEVVRIIDDGKSQEEIWFERWSDKEYCMKAVENDGYALQYVKEQTKDICMKAVENNGYALQYVKEQTKDICMKAVENNGDALQYVKEQTKDICMKAVENNGYALRYVKEKKTFLELLKNNRRND